MDYENHFSIVNSLILDYYENHFSIVNRSICSSTTIVIIIIIFIRKIHGIRFRLVLIKHVFVHYTVLKETRFHKYFYIM